jgi:hypothetical protein
MVLTAMRITAVRTGDIGIGRMATGATIERLNVHSLVPAQNKLRRRKSRFPHPKFWADEYPANAAFATPADALEERTRGDLA